MDIEGASIRVPLGQGAPESVIIFPEELPVEGDCDYLDVIDLLRSAMAPLKLWRSCAVEYYRQGFRTEFESVLNEIITALAEQENINAVYKRNADYAESMADIYNALAASELGDLALMKDTSAEDERAKRAINEKAHKVVANLQKAEILQTTGVNEYTNLVRGFYQLRQAQNDRLVATTATVPITSMPEFKNAENAFKSVYDIATKRQKRKKFLFGALVGMGIVAYTREKFSSAMDHFSKALQTHPKCSAAASVRVAIASCCFKLKQFDRARAILEKALVADPANADALVQMALLEQVAAQKERDRTKRLEHRAHAHDYCSLAAAMETSVPSTLMALNHVANHCFHTWKILVGKGSRGGTVSVTSPWEVRLEISQGDYRELAISENDPVRVGTPAGTQEFTVKSLGAVLVSSGEVGAVHVTLTLAGGAPLQEQHASSFGSPRDDVTVEVKEWHRAFKCAQDVLAKTSIAGVRAESLYIIGRYYHAQKIVTTAMEFYRESLRLRPDFVLAMFNFAQILLSRQELVGALELFEKVLSLHPDDRDTQAYVMLLRALSKKEQTPLDRIREVAPGFAYEVDLWLLQAQLRQNNPADYAAALRCYTHALECIDQVAHHGAGGAAPSVDPRVLSNIAVLHHSLGRMSLALNFCRRALVAQQTIMATSAPSSGGVDATDGSSSSSSAVDDPNPLFKNQVFEGVFYSWKDAGFTVRPNWASDDGGVQSTWAASSDAGRSESTSQLCSFEVCEVDGTTSLNRDAVDLTAVVSVGDDLMLGLNPVPEVSFHGEVLHTVVSVTATGFVTRCHVHRSLLSQIRAANPSCQLPMCVRRKVPGTNFTDAAVTLCYNYARILEDVGQTSAAREVYIQLLKQHPSFIECYLRLSRIARDVGRLDEASMWVSRAVVVEDGDPDAGVSLGDLYARGQKWDDAKKCYEKVVQRNRHDARTMLSLGNMYFANLTGNPDKYIKDSYKFFHHVLLEDNKNVYAANGLGMVCAQKGELDVAREIMSRAREAGMPLSEDICCNLAHVHLAQERYVDAEHLYQAALKTLPRSSSSSGGSAAKQSDRVNAAYECMAYAEYKHGRHGDALNSLLRGLHNDPSSLREWYNVAVVRADVATKYYRKKSGVVDDVADAMENVGLAGRMFQFLRSPSATGTFSRSRGQQPYQPKDAQLKEKACEAMASRLVDDHDRAIEEERKRNEARLDQEREHQKQLDKKNKEREEQEEAEKKAKVEKKDRVAALNDKLDRVMTQISAAAQQQSDDAANAGGGDKKRKRKATDDADGAEAPEVDGEPTVVVKAGGGRGRKKGPRARRARANVEDIFGSDSDDDDAVEKGDDDDDDDDGGDDDGGGGGGDAGDAGGANGAGASDAAPPAVASSRLSRPQRGAQGDADDDDDDVLMDVAADGPGEGEAEVGAGAAAITKTRRVVDDEDD
jgi:tetratricopeptide (TPR) repeat protein